MSMNFILFVYSYYNYVLLFIDLLKRLTQELFSEKTPLHWATTNQDQSVVKLILVSIIIENEDKAIEVFIVYLCVIKFISYLIVSQSQSVQQSV